MLVIQLLGMQCMLVANAAKKVYLCPYFPALGLNLDRYEVSLRIQSECGETQTSITPNKCLV